MESRTPKSLAPSQRVLMKGTEAIAEAAIRAGCRYFFGYPITPQNEIPEYMSKRMPQVGGVYLQAESEVATSNMLYGSGGSGARVMTSSSSPGLSLMSEGISYMVGAEIPAVIVNMMRVGPGLAGIAPAQSDYSQMTRSLGHGDMKTIVLAPGSVQESVEITPLAFDLADEYRNPVIIIGDGLSGQMMEPVVFPEIQPKAFDKNWAATGKSNTRSRNLISSLRLDPESMEQHLHRLFEKFNRIKQKEQRWEEYQMDDSPPVVLCAYGTTSRICKTAIRELRQKGFRTGLFRPITAWPFPSEALAKRVKETRVFLSIEMSMGQMVEDVRAVVGHKRPVEFWGRTGGIIPTTEEIVDQVKKVFAAL